MPRRSMADVPNRVVRLFLEDAGIAYDKARGLPPYTLRSDVGRRSGEPRCVYCGSRTDIVQEHVVPMNREACGLHAWGNVAPACRECNRIKRGTGFEEFLTRRFTDDEPRNAARLAVESLVSEWKYEPDTRLLRSIVDDLHRLVDAQTRGLMKFALTAASGAIGALHSDPPSVGPPTHADDIPSSP